MGHLLYELFLRRRRKERKEEEKKEDPVLKYYRSLCKQRAKKVSKEIEEAVKLLGWDVDPRCIPTAAAQMGMMGFATGLVLVFFYFLYLFIFEGIPLGDLLTYPVVEASLGNYVPLFVLLFPVLLGFLFYLYLALYPKMARDKLIREMIPTLPENFGYLILSMKLTPNLEKALEFAGENGEGRLAEEFRKVLWDVRMGLYTSTEEAVDKLAYKWGRFVMEVKHALMQIRGAVLEPEDARRQMRLDQALSEIVEGVRRRMEEAAGKLYMPSVQLFYLGVFLPLLLFIIMPVAAAFGSFPVNTPTMIAIYVIGLPAVTYLFARSILDKRPNIYEPPEPPPELIKDYEKIRKRALGMALGVFVVLAVLGYFLHTTLDMTYDKVEVDYCGSVGCLRQKYHFTTWEEGLQMDEVKSILQGYDTTPYWLIFGLGLALVAALGVYLYVVYKPRLELQRKFEEMEGEFKDVVYLLASRMGEGKPLEGALDSVMEFMPEAAIVENVFSKISYNVKVLGLSLRDAIFDPVFGALKDVPSKFLRKAMKILVKSVELGTELAAKALLSYSEQLRKEEEIIHSVKNKMSDIYTMMMSMAVLVGPIVLGITVALQQVIISSLSSFQAPGMNMEEAQELFGTTLGINAMAIPSAQSVELPPVWQFLLIVMVYNLILTALLTYYAVSVYEGQSKSSILLAIGKNLVISTVLFVVSAWMSVNLVRGMIG